MKKDKILELLKDRVSNIIFGIIKDTLEERKNYYIEEDIDSIRIHSEVEEREFGTYIDIVCGNNNSIVVTKKIYAPTNELRYGYITGVGLDIFTQSTSYVYDDKGRLLYRTDISDDNKYYGKDKLPLSFDKKSLLEYFKETNSEYKNGYLVRLARSMYQPFSNIWQRYDNTNVVKEYGRNPLKGEYSYIKVTFDDNSHEDINLLNESYGQFYVPGREMKTSDEKEIVRQIEEIYQEARTDEGFNYDKFMTSFNDNMFVSRGYKL